MIHHRDTETQGKLLHEALTDGVIGATIEVHRAWVFLESASKSLCHEFHLRGITFER